MKKAEIEATAKRMATEAFKARPNMDDEALDSYLMTEETRADIPRSGHTTFHSIYKKTYFDTQRRTNKDGR